VFPARPQPIDVVKADRHLLMEGTLRKLANNKAKDRYLLLFNDQLLICKPKRLFKDSYIAQRIIPTGRLLVNPHVDPRAPGVSAAATEMGRSRRLT